MERKHEAGVILRAMEPEDLDMLYHIENDRSLWNIASTNVPYSRYALHNYIADAKNDIYMDGQIRMMIENLAHEVVGVIDLVDFDPKHQRAELGIIIMKRFRRRGYAQAAISSLIEYARKVLHLRQIYAVVSVSNEVSQRCLASLGFIGDSVLKEWIYCDGHYQDARVMQFFV
ncbi:GNAT family N-acetyltransferase [Prevotella multiformis]|uniref:GNAT family N-acetyltransferase n=1 Tax=Prevotella multiformis TaxID=282402 RepID=UPI0023F5452C|nr:GNAT family N-acetyltransferase [Prevotella multiformis]